MDGAPVIIVIIPVIIDQLYNVSYNISEVIGELYTAIDYSSIIDLIDFFR
jgi:hypothetical protein